MDMNIWFKNSNYLKKNFPEWYANATSKEFTNPSLKILPNSQSLCPQVQLGQTRCYLHSLYNIKREMQEMFRDAGGEDQVLVILGLGMGYCLDYVRETKLKYKRIWVFEPYNNILQEILKRRDFSQLINMNNVSISLFKEPREVSEALLFESLHSKNIKIIYSISYQSLYGDMLDELNRQFSSRVNNMRTSIVTMDKYLLLWTKNQLISLWQNNISGSVLYNKFQDIPAVIVSAGPSLEMQMDKLKQIGDKALIVAPGTGSKILNKRGIKAHLSMATDASKAEVDLFRNFELSALLVASSRLDAEIYDIFPNQILRIILNDEFLVQYYFDYLGNKDIATIKDFGSVASCAIDYLAKLGCNPIILIGQDLCYYDNKIHADEEKDSLKNKQGLLETVDINGVQVYTSTAFLSIRHDMDGLHNRYKDKITIINATEAGLGIPGVENRNFTDIISDYINEQNVSVADIINNALQEAASNEHKASDDLDNFLKHVLEEILKIEEVNNRKIRELEKLSKIIQKGFKKNRLAGQVEIILQLNGELGENKFYKNVIMAGLHQILIYYNAGARYQSDGNLNDPESFFRYEIKEYEFTSKYIEFIKIVIQPEVEC